LVSSCFVELAISTYCSFQVLLQNIDGALACFPLLYFTCFFDFADLIITAVKLVGSAEGLESFAASLADLRRMSVSSTASHGLLTPGDELSIR
jgi:hypothetical protein